MVNTLTRERSSGSLCTHNEANEHVQSNRLHALHFALRGQTPGSPARGALLITTAEQTFTEELDQAGLDTLIDAAQQLLLAYQWEHSCPHWWLVRECQHRCWHLMEKRRYAFRGRVACGRYPDYIGDGWECTPCHGGWNTQHLCPACQQVWKQDILYWGKRYENRAIPRSYALPERLVREGRASGKR